MRERLERATFMSNGTVGKALRTAGASASPAPPVAATLTWVVLMMRVLGWLWMLALAITVVAGNRPLGADRPSSTILVSAMVVATLGTALMIIASRRGFLGSLWYVAVDGVISTFLLSAGWLAGAPDFVAGGYPMSWLFLAAFATSLKGTMVAALVMTTVFAWLHVMMGLELVRVVGSIQFLVVSLVAGWAFEALRHREYLRLQAEADRQETEILLTKERENAARLQERSQLANRLHDSVLQTIKLIMANSEDASEVRYLARIQERELRRTINQYRSPYSDSFRTRLLDARASVEDSYRVEIEQVIRDDIQMNPQLFALVEAAHEAMANAARHSGSSAIDLYAEVREDGVQINVRDRGAGFDSKVLGDGGITHSIVSRVEDAGGAASIRSTPGFGTEISLFMPAR
ncbi:MAG TPA: ATP-binding protein [Acidimicrobiia bacterium]|nr:ATP-binding protein [Acidimicrobiia bacterium]